MENLEARLEALELTVSELRKELDHERTRIRTMRQTLRCPSCGGRRILHFTLINEAGGSGVIPLSLTTDYSAWWGAQEGDPLQAFVCRGCGLVEWLATGIANVVPDGKNIIELVGDDRPTSPRSPYR